MSTGYEITFRDFQRLLTRAEYRSGVAPLLQDWFGCRVVPREGGFTLLDAGMSK
jgi:hypothetical protein